MKFSEYIWEIKGVRQSVLQYFYWLYYRSGSGKTLLKNLKYDLMLIFQIKMIPENSFHKIQNKSEMIVQTLKYLLNIMHLEIFLDLLINLNFIFTKCNVIVSFSQSVANLAFFNNSQYYNFLGVFQLLSMKSRRFCL